MIAELIPLGAYNGTPISVRQSDQYINATAMCKATGKQWNDYFRLDSTGEFLDALEEQTGIPVCDLVVSVKGQGTWVHRRVAIHLAQWCSPEFAVWVTGRIEELLLTGSTSVHREHSEAILVRAVGDIGTALCGIQELLSNHSASMEKIEGSVNRIDGRVGKLELSVGELSDQVRSIVRRREPTANTKRQHINTMMFLGGACPCCHRVMVVDEKGRKLPAGNWDHWYGPQRNGPHETWLVCADCNQKMKDQEFRAKMQRFFDAYQARRMQRHYPLLPEFVN